MRFLRARVLQVLVDMFVMTMALVLAYGIRFEGLPPRLYINQFILVLPYLLLLRVGILFSFGVYRLVWRFINLRDLPRIVSATLAGAAVLVAARFVVEPLFAAVGFAVNPAYATVPWGVLVVEFVLTTVGIIAARATWRLAKEEGPMFAHRPRASRARKKALLVGAGSAGVMVAREVAHNPDVGFSVVGFLDDDPSKVGSIIHGHRVLGPTRRMGELSRKLGAELVIITMARVQSRAVRQIVSEAEAASLKVQIIPGLFEILSGRVNISKVRDVAIEDLLGRDPVNLGREQIQDFLRNKRVLITGAGGSIGSEMCRQVCQFEPSVVFLLDQAENPLFRIHRELLQRFPNVTLEPVVGDVRNRQHMQALMDRQRPDVVFHAAAHKHVPLMESNPGEAIRNNVGGSCQMATLAHKAGVEAFVMISTDKAVHPTSVMGASKRLAEMYVQALSQVSTSRFITVRFGNVLGSDGSVVPVFQDQIARGGPVTVTHPEMKRYFMTIPEASQLVLESAAMGRGGEIFILEMWVPIKIVNLARDLIRLSGYRPDEDIAIEFSGIRPGEKLHEELNLSEENATRTRHPRIWIGNSATQRFDRLERAVDRLVDRSLSADPDDLRWELAACVPEYSPAGVSRPRPGEDAGLRGPRVEEVPAPGAA